MWQYLVNIWESVKTPLVGMRLTWKRLFVPAVTLQYPEERWELPPNSRMQLFVNMDDCIGCVQCERACPAECIYMTPSFEDSAPDRFGLVYRFAQMTPERAAELREKARKFDEAEE